MITIPIGATWRYQVNLGSSAVYADPDFDDSVWPTGATPMGYGAQWDDYTPRTGPLTSLSNVWLRTDLSASGGEVTFTGPLCDDTMTLYLDGVQVASVSFTGTAWSRGPFLVGPGSHTVAIYGTDTISSAMFIGAAVTYSGAQPTRLYPRDDGAGLSAAPRLYPPPKRQQRVVGGFQ